MRIPRILMRIMRINYSRHSHTFVDWHYVMKIHKGDTIKIISGNDKGKRGKVLAVLLSRNSVVVEGLNMKKKHVRPRTQGQKGELVRLPAPLQVSRVMLVCAACSQPTRVGYTVDGTKRKERTCKKCGSKT